MGEVAVRDEEERRVEPHRERDERRSYPLGRHPDRHHQQDLQPVEQVDHDGAGEEQHTHHEEQQEIFHHLVDEAGAAGEAEHLVQDQPERREELAGEKQQHRRAQEARQASAPDDLRQHLVQLVLVDGDELRELVHHHLHRRPPAQHEADQRDQEEEDGNETDQHVEGEPGGEEHAPVSPKARDGGPKRANQPRPPRGGPRAAYTTLRIRPPSTWTTEPVTYDARSEARKTTTLANSSGVPKRPTGISAAEAASCSSSVRPACRARSV